MTNERKMTLVYPGERVDDLQIQGLELIQNPESILQVWKFRIRLLIWRAEALPIMDWKIKWRS